MATTAPNLTQATDPPRSKAKRAWELIALLVVVGVLILGELAFQWAKHQGWTTYTTDDGLGNNHVESIAVAPDGALWAGTRGGASRFDEGTWTTYTIDDGLADNYVRSIAVAPDGVLWFGTRYRDVSRVSRFDGETWTTYTIDDVLTEYRVRPIAAVPDGALWFDIRDGGVSHFDGETWTTYTTSDGLADNDVWSIAVAPDGTLWFGTWGNGVSRFDGEIWTTYTTDDGLADNQVPSIAVAPDGTLWFSTWGNGVSRFDGATWTTYTTDDGLGNNHVESIAVAPDGTLWFGTHGGLSRFDGATWTTYTRANSGLASDLSSTLVADGQERVWLLGKGGLQAFDERMSLPVQVLQIWIVLRMPGIAALTLLAIVWIARRETGTRKWTVLAEGSTETEKRTARNWYWWLWLSPLVTVPSLTFLTYRIWFRDDYWEATIRILGSALWHLILLIPASDKRSEFVRWHGRQALLLAGARTIALLVFGLAFRYAVRDMGLLLAYVFYGLEEMLGFGYGARGIPVLIGIWFFGTLWGQEQAARGDCSLMRWFSRAEAPLALEAIVEPAQVAEPKPKPAPAAEPDPETLMDIVRYSRDPEERHKALAELKKLGMVDDV